MMRVGNKIVYLPGFRVEGVSGLGLKGLRLFVGLKKEGVSLGYLPGPNCPKLFSLQPTCMGGLEAVLVVSSLMLPKLCVC